MSLAYLDKMIAKGYGRAVMTGAFSTGVVGGGAGTVILIDEPELIIGIPSGYVMRPISIEVVVHPGVTLADSSETEALIAVDSIGLWIGDGTSTAENPSNLRTGLEKGSALRVGSAVTGAITTSNVVGTAADPVLDLELARFATTANFGDATGIIETPFRLLYEPAYPEWLEGPCTLCVYYGGTIAVIGGFVIAKWVEAPTDIMEKYAELG